MTNAMMLIVHGGAGFGDWHDHTAIVEGCREAVRVGRVVLSNNPHSALDAVETAVRALEDNPIFNAGYGSVLNRNGEVEMDALIMNGAGHRIGAVAGISRVRNPISLARLVMERTRHHLLIGAGAEAFAAEHEMNLVTSETMIAPHRRNEAREGGHDTVGAVALDQMGNLAVAVSTGGLRGKIPGRVGDSPIPGAGGYAENGLGAACATGVGEGIIRSLLSFRAVEMLRAVSTPQAAAEQAIALFGERYEGDGGLIMLDAQGRIGIAHNSPFMPVAWMGEGDLIHAQMSQGEGHNLTQGV
jgi:beta-aspartyl-peptidase (threonine type)